MGNTESVLKFRARLKDERERLGLSQQELADIVGIEQQNVSTIESGKRRFLPDNYILKMCEIGADINYLYRGVRSPRGSALLVEERTPVYGRGGIPLVDSKAAAGYTSQLLEPEFIKDLPQIYLPGPQFHNGNFCAFEVQGDSMMHTLASGDRVIAERVESLEALPRRSGVYVAVTHDSILVKRLAGPITGLSVELRSDNGGYPTIQVPRGEMKQLWFVTCRITDMLDPQTRYSAQDIELINERLGAIEAKIQAIEKQA